MMQDSARPKGSQGPNSSALTPPFQPLVPRGSPRLRDERAGRQPAAVSCKKNESLQIANEREHVRDSPGNAHALRVRARLVTMSCNYNANFSHFFLAIA